MAIVLEQVGLSEPHRVGQASSVKILFSGSRAPVQADGEPWQVEKICASILFIISKLLHRRIQEGPVEILVNHHKQVKIMAKKE